MRKRLLVPIMLLWAAAVQGGTISMSWTTVSGGGGTSSAGSFSLSATVGQLAAGPLLGPNCSLASGFWAVEFVAVQTPGAPRLTLTRSGANVILSWPASAGSFSLQSSSDLSAKQSWTAVPQSQVLVGGQIQVTVPATQAKQFFRLMSQ